MKIVKSHWIVKTYRPGMKVVKPELDTEFAKILEAEKNHKLRAMFPDKTKIAPLARNFHQNYMYMERNGTVREDLVVFTVEEEIDGIPNTEGEIAFENEDDAIMVYNALIPTGDKRVQFDTKHGKELTPEGKAKIGEVPLMYREKNPINKKKSDSFK